MEFKKIFPLIIILIWSFCFLVFIMTTIRLIDKNNVFKGNLIKSHESIMSLLNDAGDCNLIQDDKSHYAIFEHTEGMIEIQGIEFIRNNFKFNKINLYDKKIEDKTIRNSLNDSTIIKSESRYSILRKIESIDDGKFYINMSDQNNNPEASLGKNLDSLLTICVSIIGFTLIIFLTIYFLTKDKPDIKKILLIDNSIHYFSILLITILGVLQSVTVFKMGGILICPLGLSVTTISPILAIQGINWMSYIQTKNRYFYWGHALFSFFPFLSYTIGHYVAEISLSQDPAMSAFISSLSGNWNYYITIAVGMLGLSPFVFRSSKQSIS